MKRIYPANHIKVIKEYKPIKSLDLLVEELNISREKLIKLDGNENPYGVVPEVKEALATLGDIQIYPDPLCSRLVSVIATNENLPEKNIIIGAGADELIDLVIRGFTNPGDIILSQSPTFGMYSYLSLVNGISYRNIPQKLQISGAFARYCLDERKFLKAASQAKLVFLARPNNPDGQISSIDFIKRLLNLSALIIIDEAYIEFANQASLTKWVSSHENLVILRTFSKAYALGGLRVGYGVMAPSIKKTLVKIKQPYNVNIAGQEAAIQALSSSLVQQQVKQIIKTREWFIQELEKIQDDFKSFWIHRSQAAFVLLTFQSEDLVKAIYTILKSKGILTRFYSALDMTRNLRISIGTPDQMKRVIEEIKTILIGLNKL